MYCPKCKQTFEEGSRRFCPTDGARLVSEASSTTSGKSEGIFANLIPKLGSSRPAEAGAEPARTSPQNGFELSNELLPPSAPQNDEREDDGFFFEIEETDQPNFDSEFPVPAEPAE